MFSKGSLGPHLVLTLLFLFILDVDTTCDFSEDACGFELEGVSESFRWKRYDQRTASETDYTYSDPSSQAMQGSFLYITTSPGSDQKDPNGKSTAARHIPKKTNCLSFKYRIFGPNAGQLTMELSNSFRESTKFHVNLTSYNSIPPQSDGFLVDLFNKSGDHGEEWQEITLDISWVPRGKSKPSLVIYAHRGSKFHGEMALDDIEFSDYECQKPDIISCSFDYGRCGWGDFFQHDQGWYETGGYTDEKPSEDFTTGSVYGGYGKVKLDKKTKKRYTMSPAQSTFSDGQHKCLHFRYYLEDGAILMAGVRYSNKQRDFFWTSRSSDPRRKWLLGETSVFGENGDYRLILEASKDSTTDETFVAIDEIKLSDSECPIRGNNYFENGYDLYHNDESSDFDWLVTSSKDFRGVDIKDHTSETETGHYALAYFDGEDKGDKARLISPSFKKGEVSCLEFSYHISSKEAAVLKVYIGNTQEWTIIGSTETKKIKSGEWDSGINPIETGDETFQIVFEAEVGSDNSGYIALDDIIVSDTSCIAKEHQIDWSDTVPAHVPSEFDCSFEDLTQCKWESATSLDFDLKVLEIGNGPKQWDPETDYHGQEVYSGGDLNGKCFTNIVPGKSSSFQCARYTTASDNVTASVREACDQLQNTVNKRGIISVPCNSLDGSVIGSDSSAPMAGRGGLTSQAIPASSEGHCLSFWYWLRGRGASLRVLTTSVGSSSKILLWKRTMDVGMGWQRAEMTLSDKGELQVSIEVAKLSKEGSVFLDDILYTPNSCRNEKLNLKDTCTLEDGLCGFSEPPESNASWVLLHSDSASGEIPWLQGDNTYQTDQGNFLLYSQEGAEEGSEAILESPVLLLPSDRTIGDDTCVHFHYFLSGEGVGTLELASKSDSSDENVQWKATGVHAPEWLPAQVQLPNYDSSKIQIEFKAIAGPGPVGLFGIDDIAVRHGKCASPGSCGFDQKDLCTWRQGASSPWQFFQENALSFEAIPDGQSNATLISEQFTGNQVRCIHFSWAYLKGGNGSLSLSTVPVDNKDKGQLLWQLNIDGSEETGDKPTWRPGRVSVDSDVDYEIYLKAEAISDGYHVLIDNILITKQPCVAEPIDAVSLDCDFSNGFCFWYQSLSDEADWIKGGTEVDHIIAVEPAFEKKQSVARLHSPLIPAGDRCLRYSYYLQGADVGHLKVLMDVGHKKIPYVYWRGGNEVLIWRQAAVDLRNDNNYQLEFEGMCTKGRSCSLGISNIEVLPSSCPDTWRTASGSPHCTFETDSDPLCQFTPQPAVGKISYGWTREGGLDKSDSNAPTMDFTFGVSGHYAYVAPPSRLPAKDNSLSLSTSLTSPVFHSRKDGPLCMIMIFAFYMEGSESGNLHVYQVAPGERSKTPIWTAGVSDKIWEKGFVTLEQMDAFQVVFEATANRKTKKGLAIDEIFLKKGPCQDWTDICTFTEDLCLWTNSKDGSDAFDWELQYVKTSDQIRGTYLMASSSFGDKGDNAKLLSEMHFPSDVTNHICVDFKYKMDPHSSLVLSVNLLRGFETSHSATSLALWRLESSQTESGKWLNAKVSMDRRYSIKPFKIEIESTIEHGTVAIDDLQILFEECTVFPDAARTWESVLDLASCSFDYDSMCGWQDSSPDPAHWLLKNYGDQWAIPKCPANAEPEGGYVQVQESENTNPTLTSPVLPPTDGVDCLRFWYFTDDQVSDSLQLTININNNKVVLWHGDVAQTWKEVSVNIHNDKQFQLTFEVDAGSHALDNIYLTHGPCPREDVCHFESGMCGFTQDDTDQFDWELSNSTNYLSGIKASAEGHSVNEHARVKSPIYSGGGPECLEFSLHRPGPYGQLYVYAQELGSIKRGEILWNMPEVKTLDVSVKRWVQIPVNKVNPFRVVFVFKVEVADGQSPTVDDLRLLPHACEPQGWCDFEDGHCTYTTGTQKQRWRLFSPSLVGDKSYPYVDNTLRNRAGYFMTSEFPESSPDLMLELESTILSETTKFCLSFAYALLDLGSLDVSIRPDDAKFYNVLKLTDAVPYGQPLTWKTAEVDIQADGNFILTFQSYRKPGRSKEKSTVSLDDIKLLPGSCREQTTQEQASDKPVQSLIDDFSCNFESTTTEFCKYTPGPQLNGYWRRTQGSWNSSGLGFDHTRQDSQGVFASVVSTSDSKSAMARLEGIASEADAPGCLSFWYHIAGSPDNTLSVYTTMDTPLWVKTTEQDLVWQHALVELDVKPQENPDVGSLPKVALYAITFEGVLMGKEGHVALDDIEVYSDNCATFEEQGVCDFEADGLCGYLQDNHDAYHWERRKAGMQQTAGSIMRTDHTFGSSKGHLMYCCSGPEESEETSSMISPVYEGTPDGRCLVFWYKKNSGDLNILTRDREGNTRELMKIDSNEQTWKIAHLKIKSQSDFQVIFQVKRKYSETNEKYTGEVVVDDIEITPGPCHELYGCDFARDFCTWTQDIQGNAEWRITSGNPPPGQLLIGPSMDHSTNSAAGQYIILQGASEGEYSDVTTLTSQVIYIPNRQNFKLDRLCFSFWYHMSDPSAGSLTVTATRNEDSWSFNHGAEGWIQEMVTLFFPDDTSDMQISIEATVAPGRQNYIALDDLEVVDRPCVDVQQRQVFSCKDGTSEQLPWEKMCDFIPDCANGFDEKDCFSCTFEDSWCRFLRSSTNGDQWDRMPADSGSLVSSDANGYFVLTTPSKSRQSFETVIRYGMVSPTCALRFSWNLLGSKKAPRFNVEIKTHYEIYRIFQVQTPTNAWMSSEVLIGNINVPFQIVFNAFLDGNSETHEFQKGFFSMIEGNEESVGFDDFELVDCGFPAAQDKCSTEEFRCANKACVSNFKVCDFSNDCGDFSDEKGCDDNLRNDFEYSFGDWKSMWEDDNNDKWVIRTSGAATGIPRDHTPGVAGGRYIFPLHLKKTTFEAGQSSAYLASPVLAPTDSDVNPCQLRFFFRIRDHDHHALNVYTKVTSSGELRSVSYTSSSIGDWYRAVATLAEDSTFQVVIEGVNLEGLDKERRKIAVDDVSLSPSCKLSEESVTIVPLDKKSKKSPEEKPEAPEVPEVPEEKEPTTTAAAPVPQPPDDEPTVPEIPDPVKPKVDETTTPQIPDPVEPIVIEEDATPDRSKHSSDSGVQILDPDDKPSDADSQGVSKKQDESKTNYWKISVGVSMGLIALGLIVIVVAIFIKRRKPSLGFGSAERREVGFTNQMFDEVGLEEVQGTYTTNAVTVEPTEDNAARFFGNPNYEEYPC